MSDAYWEYAHIDLHDATLYSYWINAYISSVLILGAHVPDAGGQLKLSAGHLNILQLIDQGERQRVSVSLVGTTTTLNDICCCDRIRSDLKAY